MYIVYTNHPLRNEATSPPPPQHDRPTSVLISARFVVQNDNNDTCMHIIILVCYILDLRENRQMLQRNQHNNT